MSHETRKFRRLVVQLQAVNRLHIDSDGMCAECATEYPCKTRGVMREARQEAR